MCLNTYLRWQQRSDQSSTLLAICEVNHLCMVDSTPKGPVTWRCYDSIMNWDFAQSDLKYASKMGRNVE